MKQKPTKILGVILARGGSKRIPLKNINMLAGKPLISYMIEAALDSNYLDRVVVSTDHAGTAHTARFWNADVPFVRPDHLCTDECPSEPAIRHAVEFVEEEQGENIDIVVNLQCTSPLTLSFDIDQCIRKLFVSSFYKSVVSVREITERPEHMFILREHELPELFIGGETKGKRMIARNLPRMVVLNGAIYATRRDELMLNGTMVSKDTGVYIMPYERSVDIDNLIDFKFAEYLIRRGKWEKK